MRKYIFNLAAVLLLSMSSVLTASAEQSQDIAAIIAGGVDAVAAAVAADPSLAAQIVAEVEDDDVLTQSAVGSGLARAQSLISATNPDGALDIAAAVNAGPDQLQIAFAVTLVAMAREEDSGFGSTSSARDGIGSVGGGNAGGGVGSPS